MTHSAVESGKLKISIFSETQIWKFQYKKHEKNTLVNTRSLGLVHKQGPARGSGAAAPTPAQCLSPPKKHKPYLLTEQRLCECWSIIAGQEPIRCVCVVVCYVHPVCIRAASRLLKVDDVEEKLRCLCSLGNTLGLFTVTSGNTPVLFFVFEDAEMSAQICRQNEDVDISAPEMS